MANTSSRHDITVTDNGTIKKLTKEAEGLNSTLDKSASTAKKLSPVVPPAARARNSEPSVPAAARQRTGGQDAQDSGVARGVGGLTGAAGRDFAKQSEGLGGLVRLYATFAANIFAATAAFGALSRAADTTNMVKGLDQLGAASGRNLGSLAQRVVKATDSAISLREAMESVSKASSAGMDTKQILAMTDAAKKASQALGVDMGDAMSRLTRGISKLEPELLDELGLFTKVDKSTQDYARSVGKATASLTDFERRQAFANAVLAEAKQKFSVIDIPANPYNKLLASLKDVSQVALELVNKVLGPLVKLLSESPVALAGVMAGIATMLLKTAVPALGQWRQGLKDSAEEAAKTAQKFRDSFGEDFNDRLNASFRIPDLDRQFEQATKAAEKAQTRLKGLKLGSDLEDKKRTQFQGYIDDPESKAAVQRNIVAREKIIAKDIDGTEKVSAKRRLAAEAELRDLKRIKAAQDELNTSRDTAKGFKKALTSAQDAAEGPANKKIGYTDPESVAARQADKLQKAATSSRLVSGAAETASILGVRGAMRQLNVDIAKEGVSGWTKYSTVARGALAAVSTRVFGLISSLGNIGMAIGIAVAAFAVLDAIFSKNTKQMEEFDTAIKTANSSAELMGKTIANNAKQADYGISIRGIMAIASAYKEVTNSVQELNDKFSSAGEAQGWFDVLTNGIKSIFGKSLTQTYAKNLTSTIIAGLDGINSPAAKARAEANIKKLLGNISSLSRGVLQSALSNSTDLEGIGKAIQVELTEAGKGMDAASKSALNYSEVIARATKAYDEFTVGIANNSPLFKMGSTFIEVGTSIVSASKDLRSGIAALIDVAEDSSKLRFLDPKSQTQLLSFLPGLKQAQLEIGVTQTKIAELKQDIADLEAQGTPQMQARARAAGAGNSGGTAEQKAAAESTLKALEAFNAKAETTARTIIDAMTMGAKEVANKGQALISASLTAAKQMAAISITRATVSGMSGVGTAAIQASLQREEISVQERSIEAMEELTLATLAAATRQTEAALVRDLGKGTAAEQEYTKKQLEITTEVLKNVTNKTALEIDQAYNTATDAVKEAMLGFRKVTTSLAEKRVESAAKRKVVDIGEQQGTRTETAAQLSKALSARAEIFNLESEIYNLYTQQYSVLDDNNLLIRQGAELGKRNYDNAIKLKAVEDAVSEARIRAAQLNKDADLNIGNKQLHERAKAAQANLRVSERELETTKVIIELSDKLLSIQQEQAKIRNKFANDRETLKFLQEQEDYAIKLNSLNDEREQSELDYLSKVGAISGANLILANKQLDNRRLEKELAQEILAISRDKESKISVVRENTQLELRNTSAGPVDRQALLDREAETISRINANSGAALVIANAKFEQAKKYNGLLSEEEVRQQRINDLIGNLSAVFGELGSTIGTIAKIFSDMATQQELIAKTTQDRIVAENRLAAIAESGTEEEKSAATKEYNDLVAKGIKLDKDKTKNEITNSAKLAGAAKNLFKEKTAAYRGFAAVEKALHVYSMAMQMAQIVMGWQKTAAVVQQASTETVAKAAPTAAGAANGTPGDVYTKIAAGLAAFAFVMSLASGSGGGAASIPGGISAADQQETQGTGTSWKDGLQVENGRGVFGDATAKSNSIPDAIERIKETSVDNLTYASKTVKLLESIDRSISGAAKGLYGIQGIRSGSAFGNPESSSKSGGGFLGTGLFGSKSSSSITNSGIIIEGTFRQLAGEVGGSVVKIFEDIVTTTKKWYGKTKTSVNRNLKDAPEALKYINEIFGYSLDLLQTLGGKLGKGTAEINAALDSLGKIDFEASLRGLKGEELEQEISNIISSKLDDATAALFSNLAQYAEFGEGFLETVVKVIDNSEKVDSALFSISKAILTAAGTITQSSIAISQGLVDGAGGLEEFINQTEFFRDNFLTEAERLAPIQEDLAKRMKAMGIESIDTRDEFAKLVKAISLTTPGAVQLYTELMELQEAFAEVYPETRKVLSAEEKKAALLSQQIAIYKAEGKSILALYETRKEELAQMDESLVLGQLYLYALEDEADVKSKLVAAYDKEKKAIEGTVKSLDSSIKALNTYKQSLATSTQSVLTPIEKYVETKAEVLRVQAAATKVLGDNATDKEVQDKNDAINQLPQVSTAFLDASRTMYASSQAYTSDFEWIREFVDSTALKLTAERDIAQETLDSTIAAEKALGLVVTNTDTIASLTAKLESARSNVDTAAAAAAIPAVGLEIGAIDMSSISAAFTKLFEPYIALVTKLSLTPNGTLPPDVATIMPVTDRATTLSATAANADSIGQLATTLTAINNNVITLQQQNEAQAQAVVAATYDTTDTLVELGDSSYWKFSKNRFDFELA